MWLTTYNRPATRLFDSSLFNLFDDAAAEKSVWQPAIDIQENDKAYVLVADVPGVADEALTINTEDNVLTIRGKREAVKQDSNQNAYRIERSSGEFKRVFKLPQNVDVDAISANKKDGVLTIEIPKKAAQQAKAITIESH